MIDLSVSLLGPFVASLNGEPLSRFPTKSVQALLIYLVCQADRPQHREAVMDLLWPGMPLKSAQHNLRQTIYLLRRTIPEIQAKEGAAPVPLLLTSRQTIQINPDAAYFVDVDVFTVSIDNDPMQAVDLYRGDFLSDFYLPDSETFEEWASARRAAYRRQVLGALESLTAEHLQAANYNDAEKLARQQLNIDNFRESSHQQLLETLARSGKRQDALSHYESLRQLLHDELAIEPEPATTSLIAAIRLGEVTGTKPSIPRQSSQIEEEPELPKHNLPQRLASFVGREQEMEVITGLIANYRLVMLTGVGGIGKTNLCLQVGQRSLGEYLDGIWLVELAPITDPELVPQTVAYALGLRQSSGSPSPILDTLLDYLQEKECLLLLDNCEHLINAAAQLVETLLQACAKVKILASSREAFGIPGEATYRVPPLSVPEINHPPPITQWDQYDALRLFVQRAAAVLPRFQVTEDNFAQLVQICQQLDGIPLAIELAAARVNVLSTTQIAARLDDRFRLLTGGRRTALPRQQTLRALIDWSWDLLSSAEQLLLRRLSVFSGSMTLEAIEAVCASDGLDLYDILDLLSELVNKSLAIAQREQGQETHYQLLETIRQYAQELLVGAGEQEKIRHRHLDYYLQIAEQAERALVGPDQAAWTARLEKELDNIRAALNWALETDSESGLQLISFLWRFLIHNHSREGEGLLGQLLAYSNVDPDLKAKAQWVQGRFNVRLYNFDRAQALVKESLANYQKLGDQWGIAQCLNVLGTVVIDQADDQTLLLESLSLFRALEDKLGIADVLVNLGYFEGNSNNYVQATAYLEESESLYRDLGHLAGIAEVLNIFGLLFIWQQDYESARLKLEEGLALQELLGQIASSNNLQIGVLYYRIGDYTQARTHLDQSISISQRTGEKSVGFWSLIQLGYVLLRTGEKSQARHVFVNSMRQFNEAGITIGVVYSLEGLASLAVCLKRAGIAVRLFAWTDRTRADLHNPRPPVEQAEVDRDIAVILDTLGEEAYAAAYAEGIKMSMEQAVAAALEVEIA